MFKSVAGIPELAQIPYRGAGPVMTDLVGGQIPMGVVGCTAQSLGLHKSGGLRILAVTSATPLLAAPDLPTVAQAGFPGIANDSSYGLLAPAGTPKPIIDKIASASRTLLSKPGGSHQRQVDGASSLLRIVSVPIHTAIAAPVIVASTGSE